MLLIVVKEFLRALAPKNLHLMLSLAAVDPLHECDQGLVLALWLVLLDKARNALDLGLPAAYGEVVLGRRCSVDLRLASTLLAASLHSRRVEGCGCGALSTFALFRRRRRHRRAADLLVVLFERFWCSVAVKN